MTFDTQMIASMTEALWRKHLGEAAPLDRDLIAAGGDSLAAMRLLRDIERDFAIDLDFDAFVDGITLVLLRAQIARQLTDGQDEAETQAGAEAEGEAGAGEWQAL